MDKSRGPTSYIDEHFQHLDLKVVLVLVKKIKNNTPSI